MTIFCSNHQIMSVKYMKYSRIYQSDKYQTLSISPRIPETGESPMAVPLWVLRPTWSSKENLTSL